MRYIIDIPKWLDIKIKGILSRNTCDYSGINEFIIVACENQLKLDAIVLDRNRTNQIYTAIAQKTIRKDVTPREESEELTFIPIHTPTVAPVNPKDIETLVIWGQINRIFPVKLAVRVLANIIRRTGKNKIEPELFEREAPIVARNFGLKLSSIDKQFMRRSGKKLATGLPIGKKEELSKRRYVAHYLIHQTGKRKLIGALADLRLANIEDGKVGITDAGLKFAQLRNPLLEQEVNNPSTPLSSDEISLYLDLIHTYLPKEEEFMKIILKTIEGGEPPRDVFLKNVQQYLALLWNKTPTEAVANTMRSGALSRMWELRLVKNEKKGRRVVYSITDDGKNYLHGGGR